MATVTPKSSRRQRPRERLAPKSVQDDRTKGRQRKTWKRRVLVLAGGLLLFAGLLPMIVAKTPLRNLVVGMLTSDLAGEVRCESASLGWFSPVVLNGLSIQGTDGQEETILNAARVSSSKRLFDLILSGGQLGTFEIRQPRLFVVLRRDGSNIEDLLAPLLSAETAEDAAISLTVKIVDGVLTVVDTVSSERSVLSELNASFVMSADSREPMRLIAAAKVNDRRRSGDVSLNLSLGERVKLKLTSRELPIGPFAALARRVDPNFSAAGRLTCKIDALWGMSAAKPRLSVRGEVSLDEVVVTASALGNDRVELSRLAGPCDVSWADGRLSVKQLDLQCDLGSLSARGEIDLDPLHWEAIRDALSRPGAGVRLDLDLARAAAMLPETLRMKQSVRLDSGKIELTIVGGNRESSQDSNNSAQIGEAQLRMTNLRGRNRSGQELKWEEPLLARLVLRENAAARPAGELICESSFFKLNASGTFDQLTGTAQFDVGQLATQLGQFVDLGALQLNGRGKGSFNWHCDRDGVFGVFASMDLFDVRISNTPERVWQEDHVRLKSNVTGILADATLESVYSAKCDVESSGEQITLQLTDPVFNLDELPRWPFEFRLVGNLENWENRLSLWTRFGNMQIAGICDLQAKFVVDDGDVELSGLRADVTDLDCRGSGWNVYESAVKIDASGKWAAADRQLVIAQAAVQSKALAISGQDLRVTLPASGPITVGAPLSYRADLSRIQAWFENRQTRPTTTIEGALSGKIKAVWRQDKWTFETQSDGKNIRLVQWTPQRTGQSRAEVVWSEPVSRLVAQVSFDSQQDRLGVERFELVSPGTFELSAKGSVAELTARRMIDLSGSVDYDLDRISLAMRPWLGSNVQFKGKGPRDFSIKGPMTEVAVTGNARSSPEMLAARGAIGWSSGKVFGMEVGQGELQVGLDRGTVTIRPIDLNLSEGRLTLAPTLRTTGGKTMLLFPKGPVLSKVRLTPQMCSSAMKYIHPFLAGATQIDGHVSLDLQNGQIPLDAPEQAKIAGVLRIHSVQISDGPLVRQLLPLMAIPPQRVPLSEKVEFWVDRGRVYHRGVGIVAGGVTITTRGSVGIEDETLDLLAEMPVPAKWIGNNALGTALRGQVIQIPIGGTLSKPKIDARRLDQLRARFVREAAGNLLRDELLDRVFGK